MPDRNTGRQGGEHYEEKKDLRRENSSRADEYDNDEYMPSGMGSAARTAGEQHRADIPNHEESGQHRKREHGKCSCAGDKESQGRSENHISMAEERTVSGR